jgi:hypothetical protein
MSEILLELAQFAGQTVVAAAITDLWESVRTRFARLLGHGDVQKTARPGSTRPRRRNPPLSKRHSAAPQTG